MSEQTAQARFTEDKYILIGQTPTPCTDLLEWAHWFETGDRRVAQTLIGDWDVSTVFLGLDHNHARIIGGEFAGPPILFETMIFYIPASKLKLPDPTPEALHRWAEERDALIDTLPPKEQELVDYQDRYAAWLEAERGHETAVRLVEETTGAQRVKPEPT